MKKGWKEYKTADKGDKLYQKIIAKKGINIGLNVYEYKLSWELEIQIPDSLSIVGNTINITVLSYDKLDFSRIERDGKKIIDRLVKK